LSTRRETGMEDHARAGPPATDIGLGAGSQLER
jgi:hypothetical protein